MLHSLFKLFSLKYIWNSIPNYLHISRSMFGTCTSQIPFWTAAVPLLCPAMVGSSTTHTACSSHVPIILEVLFVSTRPSWKSAASPPLQINLAGSCSAIITGATVISAILISPLLPLAWRSPTPWSMPSCPATRQEWDDTFSQIPAVRKVSQWSFLQIKSFRGWLNLLLPFTLKNTKCFTLYLDMSS